MTEKTTGSWSSFDPQEVIERIEVHLKRIEIIREDKKKEWFQEKREEGKTTGFWFFKKTVPWTEEELEKIWKYGATDFFLDSPKFALWNTWNQTVNNFERIRDFCQLATDAGNRTVNLSKEDALFAYNWK